MAHLAVVDEYSDNMSTTLTQTSSTQSPHSTAHTSFPSTPIPAQGGGATLPATGISNRATATLTDEDVVDGWPLIAKMMATKPELEAFPRFRELNTKNLLYYQVELDYLSERLKAQEKKDCGRTHGDEDNYAKFADSMISIGRSEYHGDEPVSPKARRQWDFVVRIRKLLKEYNAALLQQSQISALPEPSRHNVNFLREWITRTEGGNFCIGGSGSKAWGELHQDLQPPVTVARRLLQFVWRTIWAQKTSDFTVPDLVATHPRRKIDGFTRWIEEELIPCYHECRYRPSNNNNNSPGTDVNGDVERQTRRVEENKKNEDALEKRMGVYDKYSENNMLRFTSSVATVIACILPTVAIGVLTTADTTMQKLLYIGGFTALFSIGLMYLTTEASRLQIFTATAAFSAVLVVFVQGS